YGWDVIEGNWRVIWTKDGYEPYTSRVVTVPPAETQLNVPLVRATNPMVEEITPSNDAINVPVDTEVTITFDRLMNEENIEELIQVFKGDQLVDGSFTLEGMNGYREVPGKKGYFEEDTSKKLSQTFRWTPSEELDSETTYTIKISSDMKDYADK